MAADDDVVKKRREELRKRLLNQEPITVGKSGEIGTNSTKDAKFISDTMGILNERFV